MASFDSEPAPSDPRPEPPSAAGPLLASEALRAELAPVEPWRAGGRLWCAMVGLWFGVLALVPSPAEAFGSPAKLGSLALGAVALFVAAVPIGYAVRAALVLLVALTTALLGVAGLGPAAAAARPAAEWTLLYVLAAAALPAALFFRAHYRAYAPARAILAAGLAAALPFASRAVLLVASDAHTLVQVGAAVALGALGASLIGFMGSETTAAASYLAAAVFVGILGALGCELVAATDPAAAWSELALGAGSWVAASGVALLGAIGVFQLLASRHWREARAVDVRPLEERPSMRSLPGDVWSTKD
jgi:hypothetical protein